MKDSSEILYEGNDVLDDFSLEVLNTSNRKIDLEVEKLVKAEWEILLEDARKKGLQPWDGMYYRFENLESFSPKQKEIVISGSVRYSETRVFQKMDIASKLDHDYHTLVIATVALVKTSDDFVIFGYRENTMNNTKVTPIGGGLQPDELEVKEIKDFERNVIKEVEEELNISKEDIGSVSFNGIIRDIKEMVVLFSFDIEILSTKDEIEKSVKQLGKDSEHDSIIFLKEEELKEFGKQQVSFLREMIDIYLRKDS